MMTNKTATILHSEDDPAHRLLVRKNLIDLSVSFNFFEVEDGQEAIDYIYGVGKYVDRTAYPIPDIILLDIKMPKMDGFEVLKKLKNDSDKKHIPIIMLTTSAKEEDIVRGYKYGANAYLTKPVDYNHFAQKLKNFKLFWILTAEKAIQF